MNRTTLLAGSAMALALAAAGTAQAATCTTIGLTITCDQPASDPVANANDNVTVDVTNTGAVYADSDITPTIDLSGNDVAVNNDGAITQSDKDGFAIKGSGDNVTVTNSGNIDSDGRAIVMFGGSNLTVINQAGATIHAEKQTIRAGSNGASPGARVENHGTISSADGRALQIRSDGASVLNHGLITGGEEVIEARANFTLENHGTIMLNDPAITDEDGVQFASGTVNNHGRITGSDDGIDVDEGLIINHAGATIRSTAPDANDNSGIDIDEVFDDGDVVRANTDIRIVNAGLIDGPSAIGSDPAATNRVIVENTGTLNGRGGTAIRLAPGQGDSSLSLDGNSEIYGDVLFGSGMDLVSIASLTSGQLIAGVFDGGLGFDTVEFTGFGLDGLQSFNVAGNTVELSFLAGPDLLMGTFINFEGWGIGGKTYSTDALAAAVQAAAVPLPAGLPLLLAGLGGLGLLRRRQRNQ